MLDANTAEATLETKAVPGDVGARAMLNSISNSKTKRGEQVHGIQAAFARKANSLVLADSDGLTCRSASTLTDVAQV